MLHKRQACLSVTFPATLQRSAVCSGRAVLSAHQGLGEKHLQQHLRSTADYALYRFCNRKGCVMRIIATAATAADCTEIDVADTAPANGDPRPVQLGHEAHSEPFEPSKYAVVASVVVPPSCSSADYDDNAAEGTATGGCAEGSRVAEALCELLPAQFATITAAKRALRRGRVSLDGRPADTHMSVWPGQTLALLERVRAPKQPPSTKKPANLPADSQLTVAFEDDHLACIVKPQGVPTQAQGPVLDVHSRLLHSLAASAAPGAMARPRHAHRLDSPTGGLLLVGKTHTAVAALCSMFVDRKITKRYRAAVYGRMTGSGTIESELDGRTAVTHWEAVAHLPASTMHRQDAEPSAASGASARACGECSNDRGQQADDGGSGSTDAAHLAAASDTHLQPQAAGAGDVTTSRSGAGNSADGIQHPAEVTILDLRPVTGRRHQLRRHLARAGHPIWGDPQHTGGHPAALAAARAATSARRQAQGVHREAGGKGSSEEATQGQPAAPHGAAADCSMAAVDANAVVAKSAAESDGSSDVGHADIASDEHAAGLQRLALWAVELQLRHPVTGQQLRIVLPHQAELASTCPELMLVPIGTS